MKKQYIGTWKGSYRLTTPGKPEKPGPGMRLFFVTLELSLIPASEVERLQGTWDAGIWKGEVLEAIEGPGFIILSISYAAWIFPKLAKPEDTVPVKFARLIVKAIPQSNGKVLDLWITGTDQNGAENGFGYVQKI